MFSNKTFRNIFIVVIALTIWGYIAGLSIDFTRDAGKYATIAKEIFQNGNYINLTVLGEAYDQKPPMLFWLGALGFSIGGISNFWFKLPVLLLVFAGFYWAFQLGKSLYNKRVGYLTAIMLSFSFIYSMYSMDIHTDTPLQAFITLALWQLFEFIKTKKTKHWILGFFAIGLAMLCKGPIGAAIPAFAVIGHLLLKKDFRFLFDYRWFLGIILAFIVVSPALIGLMNQFGWDGIYFFFWENNVGRISGSYVQANNDPLFYIHNLAYLFLPWSLLFFVSAFFEFKFLFKNKFNSIEYFTFTGIWIFFIIINTASSQLPNYIFAIVPLIAVLTAKWIDIALDKNAKQLRIFNAIQKGISVIIWLFIVALSTYFFPAPKTYYWVLIIIGIIASIYVLLKEKDKLTRLIIPTLISFTCFTFLLNTHVFPYMFSFQAPPKAARYFNANARTAEKLYNYSKNEYPYEIYFYSNPQATQIKTSDQLEEVATVKGSWIFTNEEGLTDIEKLQLNPDTIISYKHLSLNSAGRFINPKNRDNILQDRFLIKLAN